MAKEAFSAIPSWSGYIYQGKIAFYHVLRIIADKLAEDHNFEFENTSLEVEWQEDFAIKVGRKYESVHQVKAYQDDTKVTDYKEAILGLLRKVQSHYTKGYLHILTPIKYNSSITDFPTYKKKFFYIDYYPRKYAANVNVYSYCTGSETCGLDEVDRLIFDKIENIYSHKNFGIPSLTSKQYEYVQFKLYQLLDTHILEVHKKLRREHQTIPFSNILEVFTSNYEEYSEEYKYIKVKDNLFEMFNRYCSNTINCNLDSCEETCYMYQTEESLKSKTAKDVYDIVLQSTPHYDNRLASLMDMRGLTSGLTKAFHILNKDYQTPNYLYKNHIFYLPTTIHNPTDVPNIAKQIIENKGLDAVFNSYQVDVFISEDVTSNNILQEARRLKNTTDEDIEAMFGTERGSAIDQIKRIKIEKLNDIKGELS